MAGELTERDAVRGGFLHQPVDAAVLLIFSQDQIDDPAATDMLAGLLAMIEDVGIGAAGVFESVGEDGKKVEGAVGVDGLGHISHTRCSPGMVEPNRVMRIAKQITEEIALAL